MSDIFLNWFLDDVEWARELRDAFRQQGWTVWWNPLALHFSDSDPEVGGELNAAKVIVTLWSQRAARKSSNVRKTLKRLSPALPVLVLLDKAAPPPVFPPVLHFDLFGWDGSESHAGLQSLLRHLRKLITTSPPTAAPPESLEELSLSKIQESARQGIREGGVARPENDVRFKGVFISYRRSEAAAYAGRLYDRLASRFGKERVFIDTENVGRGADFVEAITSAAESCAVMIALVSRQWARATGGEQDEDDDYVRLEVAAALGRKIPLIPITIQGASMPRAKELPDDLAPIARRNAFELRDARWERDVEDLILDLEKLLNG